MHMNSSLFTLHSTLFTPLRGLEHVEAQQAPHFAYGICRCLGNLHADIPAGRRQRTD
jgi:hypothetical protein